MSFTLIVPLTSIWYLVGRAIDLGTIIAVFGIWCEGRSLFFTQASISVESSQCLVFGVRGDRKYKLFALFITTPAELDKPQKPHHDQISSSDLLNALQSLSRRCSIKKQESLYTLPPVLKQYIKGL